MIRVPVMVHHEGTMDSQFNEHRLLFITETQRTQSTQRKPLLLFFSAASVLSVPLW